MPQIHKWTVYLPLYNKDGAVPTEILVHVLNKASALFGLVELKSIDINTLAVTMEGYPRGIRDFIEQSKVQLRAETITAHDLYFKREVTL
jgi:hypothetical protein